MNKFVDENILEYSKKEKHLILECHHTHGQSSQGKCILCKLQKGSLLSWARSNYLF